MVGLLSKLNKNMELCYRRKRNVAAINVCSSNIIKSLKCDHPSSEGYEVGNLISNNSLERSKGFFVERFIKPPVTLTFEFTDKIDLKYIFVQCNVGAQKTSGIELSIQSDSCKKPFESISSGVLKENEKGFVFHRHNENVRTKFGEEFLFRSIKFSPILSVVKSVRIKIFRTQGSSVPALGKVEIWGVPHTPLPALKNTNITCQNLNQTCQLKGEDEIKTVMDKRTTNKRTLSSHKEWPQSIIIPEDFIDPITCDIMCQPVTLPSGKVIDNSTLESYEKAESAWGRGLSDPFTGIPFTSSSKPIAASDLKARIDKFLCDNSNNPEFQKIPRTVGRSSLSSQTVNLKPNVSKLICNQRISPCRVPKNTLSTVSQCFDSVKRIKVENPRNQNCKIQSNLEKEVLIQQNSFEINAVSSSKISTDKSFSFQERMEKSLELSLKSTLSSFPSFTADEKESKPKTLVECNVCNLCNNLFSLPCDHYICRKCLVILNTKEALTCSLCKSFFKSCDVQKVHACK